MFPMVSFTHSNTARMKLASVDSIHLFVCFFFFFPMIIQAPREEDTFLPHLCSQHLEEGLTHALHPIHVC